MTTFMEVSHQAYFQAALIFKYLPMRLDPVVECGPSSTTGTMIDLLREVTTLVRY